MRNYLENKLKKFEPGHITSIRGITVVTRDNLEYDLDFEELVDIYPDKKSEFIEEIKVFNPRLHNKITEKEN